MLNLDWIQVKKQDMTLQQLRVYDGESEACDGSICVAGFIHSYLGDRNICNVHKSHLLSDW